MRELDENLFLAIKEGCLSKVTSLIKDGANIFAINDKGWSVIHEACNNGNLAIVRFLVEQGADVNLVYSFNGATPIIISLDNKSYDVAKYIIDRGANINAKDNGNYSVLHFCVHFDIDKDFIAYLIDKGVDISLEDNNGMTACDFASAQNKKYIAEFIEKYTAEAEFKKLNNVIKTDNIEQKSMLF